MEKRKQRRSECFPKSPTCADRIDKHLKHRITDLRVLWKAYENGEEEVQDLGTLSEYGLAFDFVVPKVESGSEIAYFRYQLSWGGPSDEFRFFAGHDGKGWKPYRVEYCFSIGSMERKASYAETDSN